MAREEEGPAAVKLPPSCAAAAAEEEEDPAPKHPPRLRRARRRDGASARLLPAPISLAGLRFRAFRPLVRVGEGADERNDEEIARKCRACGAVPSLYIFRFWF
jgi:hypothetical protein